MSMFEFNTTYKPFNYGWAEQLRQQHEEVHWVTNEVEMTQDVEQWNTIITPEEKEFVKALLSMFTQSDVAVGKFYVDYLLPRVKNNELRNMLMSFAAREAEHQRGYAHLNESLGLPDNYWTEFLEHKETLDKWEYMTDKEIGDNFGLMLAKQVFMEGVSLFSTFTMLKNFERHGKLLGTCKINEWSLRDETLHVEGNSRLFRIWAEENPQEINDDFKKKIYDIARDVIKLEESFIDFAFDTYEIEGLTKEEVKEYVRYIADRRLVQLGMKENWGIESNPLPWMDVLSNGSSLQNFFEGRVADYEVGGMTGSWGY